MPAVRKAPKRERRPTDGASDLQTRQTNSAAQYDYAIPTGSSGRHAAKVDILPVSDVKFLLPSGVVETRSSDDKVDKLEEYWNAKVIAKKWASLTQTWLKAYRPDSCLLCAVSKTKSKRADDASTQTACDTCVGQGRPCISSTPEVVFPLIVIPEDGADDDDPFGYFC